MGGIRKKENERRLVCCKPVMKANSTKLHEFLLEKSTTVDRSNWIDFTEEANALDYLEKACFFIGTLRDNPQNWKWVILAIHGAMYGFAICTLKGTELRRVTEKSKLIRFSEAIERCQKEKYMKMTVTSKPLALSKEQKQSIKNLDKEFRDNFVHFLPTGWSIEISGMPEIIKDCLDVIKFLALETGNYTNLTSAPEKNIEKLIQESILTL